LSQHKINDDPRTNVKTAAELKPKIAQVKAMFPQKLSEAETNKLK
jgi:hypothetical protein